MDLHLRPRRTLTEPRSETENDDPDVKLRGLTRMALTQGIFHIINELQPSTKTRDVAL